MGPACARLFQDRVIRAKLPTYSPDGTRIAFIVQTEGTTQDLWVMNADGTGAAAVAAEEGIEDGPDWNGDGSAITYTYTSGRDRSVKKVRLSDGAITVLVKNANAYIRPHVSPDEMELLYETGTPANIWRMPLRGGPAKQLTFAREGAGFPHVSSDNRWIIYELRTADSTQIGLMDRDGGSQQTLTAEPGHCWGGSWADDNRRFSFVWFRDGVWNIWSMDRATRERRQVSKNTAFGPFARTPAWRPGSEEIAHEWSEVRSNIFLLTLPD